LTAQERDSYSTLLMCCWVTLRDSDYLVYLSILKNITKQGPKNNIDNNPIHLVSDIVHIIKKPQATKVNATIARRIIVF